MRIVVSACSQDTGWRKPACLVLTVAVPNLAAKNEGLPETRVLRNHVLKKLNKTVRKIGKKHSQVPELLDEWTRVEEGKTQVPGTWTSAFTSLCPLQAKAKYMHPLVLEVQRKIAAVEDSRSDADSMINSVFPQLNNYALLWTGGKGRLVFGIDEFKRNQGDDHADLQLQSVEAARYGFDYSDAIVRKTFFTMLNQFSGKQRERMMKNFAQRFRERPNSFLDDVSTVEMELGSRFPSGFSSSDVMKTWKKMLNKWAEYKIHHVLRKTERDALKLHNGGSPAFHAGVLLAMSNWTSEEQSQLIALAKVSDTKKMEEIKRQIKMDLRSKVKEVEIFLKTPEWRTLDHSLDKIAEILYSDTKQDRTWKPQLHAAMMWYYRSIKFKELCRRMIELAEKETLNFYECSPEKRDLEILYTALKSAESLIRFPFTTAVLHGYRLFAAVLNSNLIVDVNDDPQLADLMVPFGNVIRSALLLVTPGHGVDRELPTFICTRSPNGHAVVKINSKMQSVLTQCTAETDPAYASIANLERTGLIPLATPQINNRGSAFLLSSTVDVLTKNYHVNSLVPQNRSI
eukprot:Gregarina_sp_Poly_1__2535@NODE_1689_length_3531_cov_474_954965_g1110_i0_p1_GENE_NODE_1689_length_3531_cov_474_954965_g1110_i0NODE_1689_length_3531_cov_474_954965_g1110_i0_p1_ORF_typecomplete_len571_score68_90EB1/PF03271_17/0_2EB1/PF03271_17/8_7e03SID/PF11778_8/0_25MMM1/PF10296_9/3e03MMM1/PF10296_9/0_61_NODE_1689_length_3531_cov_474_954965_g1110_i05262238